MHDLHLLDLLEFYAEDIRSLEAMGVVVETTNVAWQAMTARADFLYAWWWHTSLPVIVIWRARRRPAIVTGTSDLREPWTSHKASKRILRDLLTRLALRVSTVNIAVSDHERNKLRDAGASRVERLYHSVDTSYFRPADKFPTPTAIVVAQLNPMSIVRKGVDIAVRGVALAQAMVPNLRLLLVGPTTEDGVRLVQQLQDELTFKTFKSSGKSRDERNTGCSLRPGSLCSRASTRALACPFWRRWRPEQCQSAQRLARSRSRRFRGDLLERTDYNLVSRAIVDLSRNTSLRNRVSDAPRRRALDFDSRKHASDLASILRRWGIAVPRLI